MFKALCEKLAYFLDFPPETAAGTTATLALWIMFTYIYPCWSSVPYLSVGGPMASGKTTLFRLLAKLCFRPLESSNMTAACLFRTLHEQGGVLLLDEAERLRDGSPEAGELRSILLSGYKKGSPAQRLEKVGDSFRRVSFDVFGPKALAAIAALPEALASRCIRLTMFRSAPTSPKPRRHIDADPTWTNFRDSLHSLSLNHGPIWIDLANNPNVCPASLNGRDYELWQPLFGLATWLEAGGVGGLVNLLTDFAAQTVEAARDDSIPDADETLLRILTEHVIAGTQAHLTPSGLHSLAQQRDPLTFGTERAVKWSVKGVTFALKRYGVESRKYKGVRAYAHVTLDQLRRIDASYFVGLPIPPASVLSVQSVHEPGLDGLFPGDSGTDRTDRTDRTDNKRLEP